MKILWLTNIPLPEASILMDEKLQQSGGWLINASKDLAKQEDIELSIAFPKAGVNSYQKFNGQNISYYAFPTIKYNDSNLIENNLILKKIIQDVKPGLVHIYGTELAHTISMVNVCNSENVQNVISIQGLVSVIEKHMYANLPYNAIYGFTLRNLLRKDNVVGLKNQFIKRGTKEIEAIKNSRNLIGRTTWDKACTSQINPDAQYHFCNETLRGEFYKHQWNIDTCEKHSIFLSQGQYPIKGLHYVLEALPSILRKFPDTKLYISGKNIIKKDTLRDKILMTHYGKYIRTRIKKLGVENNVVFTGPLDEIQMCQRYLKTHVFVCPSTIENSPNSLGEAMILGVPSVASYVGGIPDMLKDKEEGFLYQHDAHYMLAHYVCEIFENEDLALKFSKQAREHALKIHDRDKNTRRLIEIYNDILSN